MRRERHVRKSLVVCGADRTRCANGGDARVALTLRRSAGRSREVARCGQSWHHREMLGFAPVELAIRVRGRAGWAPIRLRRRRDPLARWGRVWQLVVELDGGHPALLDVLATCHGFRVDDVAGGTVGVVEDVVMAADGPGPVGLIVRAWDRRWCTVSMDEVVEVVAGARRLVTNRAPGCAG